MCAKQIQLRRGTTAQHSTFTGAVGEVTVDTDKDVVVVHDGATAGGFPMAKQASVDGKVAKITSVDNQVVRFNGTTGEVQGSGVVIDDSGNVGIGTNSPSTGGLTVRGITANYSQIHLASGGVANNSRQAYLRCIDGGTAGSFDGNAFSGLQIATQRPDGGANAGMEFYTSTGATYKKSMVLDSSGNVGIGVTPSVWASTRKVVDVGSATSIINTGITSEFATNAYYDTAWKYKATGAASDYIQASNGWHYWYTAPSGTAGNAITWTNAMTLDSSGNLAVGASGNSGIKGVTVKSYTLSDAQTSYFQAQGGTAGTLNRYATMGVRKHVAITNSCGYIQINCQDGAENNIWVDDSDQLRISLNQDHIGTTSGTVIGTQTSDERVKNIVGTCPYGLSEILELETIKYSMKDDVEGTYKLGFTAQQSMGVVPEIVYDTNEYLRDAITVTKQKVVVEAKDAVLDEEGNVIEPAVEAVYEDYEDIEYVDRVDEETKLAMDYSQVIPILVNAMKEQQAIIDGLKARIETLEAK